MSAALNYKTSNSTVVRFRVLEGGLSHTAPQNQTLVVKAHKQELAPAKGLSMFSYLALAFVGVVFALTLVGMDVLSAQSVELHFNDAAIQKVTVHKGDSLWDIAVASGYTGESTRAAVGYIKQINKLENSSVIPGQELLVPTHVTTQ